MPGVCTGHHFHLSHDASPVSLLWEVHGHVQPIPVDVAYHAHTLVRDRTPLVPSMEGRRGGVEDEGAGGGTEEEGGGEGREEERMEEGEGEGRGWRRERGRGEGMEEGKGEGKGEEEGRMGGWRTYIYST